MKIGENPSRVLPVYFFASKYLTTNKTVTSIIVTALLTDFNSHRRMNYEINHIVASNPKL